MLLQHCTILQQASTSSLNCFHLASVRSPEDTYYDRNYYRDDCYYNQV